MRLGYQKEWSEQVLPSPRYRGTNRGDSWTWGLQLVLVSVSTLPCEQRSLRLCLGALGCVLASHRGQEEHRDRWWGSATRLHQQDRGYIGVRSHGSWEQ